MPDSVRADIEEFVALVGAGARVLVIRSGGPGTRGETWLELSAVRGSMHR